MESALGSSGGASDAARAFAGTWLLAMAATGDLGCSEHHRVELAFGDGPQAFLCRDEDAPDGGRDLAARAQCVEQVTVVVDFIRLEGGVPACFSGEIKAWCQAGEDRCDPIEERRRYHQTKTPPETDGSSATRSGIDAVLDALGGDLVVEDAPGGAVIVRVVATAQDPSSLEQDFPTFKGDQILGCAISCPVDLDEVSGSLGLDLPMLGNDCVQSVCGCANPGARGDEKDCGYSTDDVCGFLD